MLEGDMSLIEPTRSRAVDGRLPQDIVATCHNLIAKNQAMLDQDFLLARKREGLSVERGRGELNRTQTGRTR